MWIVEEQVENSTECESLEEQFGLYKDEYGVICCQGRLSNSSLPYTTKYPMLLPKKGKLAEFKGLSLQSKSWWTKGNP